MELNKYLRIGIDYYKELEIPMRNDTLKTISRWSKQTIVDDFGGKAIKDISKFEGFCLIPSHVNFKRNINGFYNRYEALSYPLKEGKWDNINLVLHHIFGEQYEIGIDYLTILWKYPLKTLPILCLVSEERNTGKTTFLNLLKMLFESNITINTNDDFRSRFNSDWTGKLIIAVDEVLLDKREDSERIKNLSTAKNFKKESKGKDKEEVEFFGKFILCSNNETNFIKLDANEIRYWVRKISSLKNHGNPTLDKLLRTEIPAFAFFLNNREIVSKELTRMWFTKEQIHTKALDLLINGNKSNVEKELEELLLDEFSYFGCDELSYTPKDLLNMLKTRNVNVNSNYITTILKEKFKLQQSVNSSYKFYNSNLLIGNESTLQNYQTCKGRFYTFNRKMIKEMVE